MARAVSPSGAARMASRLAAGRRMTWGLFAIAPQPIGLYRDAAVPRLMLAPRLFAVTLVRADGPFRLTAVLPGAPALLAISLGDDERAVS